MAASGSSNGALAAFERNNYFYGLLMDESRFNKQELYFNHKRWLLNRLVLGSGVVCGLDVTSDPQNPGMVFINPGVAIDGLGREIIVPTQVRVNALKLTDDQGNPGGDAQPGDVVICLAYAESLVDPVPVLVSDCDHPGNCACSTVREQFRILVRQADPKQEPKPPSCTLGEFPLPVDGVLQHSLSQRISAACPSPPADPCVPLAHVDVVTRGIQPGVVRPLVYDNALLYELTLCLSDRVNQVMQKRVLRYVSGDAQSARKGEKVQLVVELVDWASNPVLRPKVQFKVTTGGGTVEPAQSADDQAAQASWALGDPGIQEVIATADGSPFIVKFHATATE